MLPTTVWGLALGRVSTRRLKNVRAQSYAGGATRRRSGGSARSGRRGFLGPSGTSAESILGCTAFPLFLIRSCGRRASGTGTRRTRAGTTRGERRRCYLGSGRGAAVHCGTWRGRRWCWNVGFLGPRAAEQRLPCCGHLHSDALFDGAEKRAPRNSDRHAPVCGRRQHGCSLAVEVGSAGQAL